jgi:hypothetical protein
MTELEVLDLTGLCEVVAGIVLGLWAYASGVRKVLGEKVSRKGMVSVFLIVCLAFGYFEGEAYGEALGFFVVLLVIAYRFHIVGFLMPISEFIAENQWIGALVSGLIGAIVGFGSGHIFEYIFMGMVVGCFVWLLLMGLCILLTF